MTPRLRKAILTAHVASSVGWAGAVAVFFTLGVVGLSSDDPNTVRGVFTVMAPVGWAVLVPLASVSLLTGLIQSLGTKWGLLQHYWVLVKLLINVAAIPLLLLYMPTLNEMADTAAQPIFTATTLNGHRISPVLHSAVAELLLLTATALAVCKPRGLTRHGQRKHTQRHDEAISRRARNARP